MHTRAQTPPTASGADVSKQLKEPASGPTPRTSGTDVQEVVASVIKDVRERGDEAVRDYSEKCDNWSPENFRLTAEEIEEITAGVSQEALDDIRTVQANVRGFAQRQLESMQELEVETQSGVFL